MLSKYSNCEITVLIEKQNMLKFPERQSRQPHVANIERPSPQRRLQVLRQQYIMPKRPTRSEEMAKITSELNERLISLQMRVADWKAMRQWDDKDDFP